MKKVISVAELINSVRDGVFTRDGQNIPARDVLYSRNLHLKSLMGSPKKVHGSFECNGMHQLTSLTGGPFKTHLSYSAVQCSLTSLDGIAKNIGTDLWLDYNSITNLHNIHLQIESVGANLPDGGLISLDYCPISSHILGLLKIKHLRRVYLDNVIIQDIINNHLFRDRDILDCAEELVEAGFSEYARL